MSNVSISTRLLVAIALMSSFLPNYAGAQNGQMKFAINNANSANVPDNQVWVLFFTGVTAVSGTYNSISMGPNTSVSPTTIGAGNTNAIRLSDVAIDPGTGRRTFDLTAFNGQMWFNYGTSPVDFTNGAPSGTSTAPTQIANFNKRWQFIEPTINIGANPSPPPTNNYGVDVDQTIIDTFSIPITVQANSAPFTKAVGVPANNQFINPTNTIVQALAGSTAQPLTFSNVYSNTTPLGGPPVNPGSLPDPNLARVVSPTQATSLYHDWTSYMAALVPGGSLSAGLNIQIADSYVGSGAGTGLAFDAQYFDLTATVNPSLGVTLTGNTYDSQGGPVKIAGLTLTSTFADLNATTGIYGNAAVFNWTSTTPIATFTNPVPSTSGMEDAGANDVLGTIMGDLLAGLSMGYPGSTFGNANPSGTWWANPSHAFGAAQTNPDFYDTWAAALFPLTSSYGVGYEDRFGKNLLAFANGAGVAGYSGAQTVNGGFLEITLHPDSAAVAEPGSLALATVGFAGLVGYSLRWRRARATDVSVGNV